MSRSRPDDKKKEEKDEQFVLPIHEMPADAQSLILEFITLQELALQYARQYPGMHQFLKEYNADYKSALKGFAEVTSQFDKLSRCDLIVVNHMPNVANVREYLLNDINYTTHFAVVQLPPYKMHLLDHRPTEAEINQLENRLVILHPVEDNNIQYVVKTDGRLSTGVLPVRGAQRGGFWNSKDYWYAKEYNEIRKILTTGNNTAKFYKKYEHLLLQWLSEQGLAKQTQFYFVNKFINSIVEIHGRTQVLDEEKLETKHSSVPIDPDILSGLASEKLYDPASIKSKLLRQIPVVMIGQGLVSIEAAIKYHFFNVLDVIMSDEGKIAFSTGILSESMLATIPESMREDKALNQSNHDQIISSLTTFIIQGFLNKDLSFEQFYKFARRLQLLGIKSSDYFKNPYSIELLTYKIFDLEKDFALISQLIQFENMQVLQSKNGIEFLKAILNYAQDHNPIITLNQLTSLSTLRLDFLIDNPIVLANLIEINNQFGIALEQFNLIENNDAFMTFLSSLAGGEALSKHYVSIESINNWYASEYNDRDEVAALLLTTNGLKAASLGLISLEQFQDVLLDIISLAARGLPSLDIKHTLEVILGPAFDRFIEEKPSFKSVCVVGERRDYSNLELKQEISPSFTLKELVQVNNFSELFAVDIKFDDIVNNPDNINAFNTAIDQLTQQLIPLLNSFAVKLNQWLNSLSDPDNKYSRTLSTALTHAKDMLNETDNDFNTRLFKVYCFQDLNERVADVCRRLDIPRLDEIKLSTIKPIFDFPDILDNFLLKIINDPDYLKFKTLIKYLQSISLNQESINQLNNLASAFKHAESPQEEKSEDPAFDSVDISKAKNILENAKISSCDFVTLKLNTYFAITDQLLSCHFSGATGFVRARGTSDDSYYYVDKLQKKATQISDRDLINILNKIDYFNVPKRFNPTYLSHLKKEIAGKLFTLDDVEKELKTRSGMILLSIEDTTLRLAIQWYNLGILSALRSPAGLQGLQNNWDIDNTAFKELSSYITDNPHKAALLKLFDNPNFQLALQKGWLDFYDHLDILVTAMQSRSIFHLLTDNGLALLEFAKNNDDERMLLLLAQCEPNWIKIITNSDVLTTAIIDRTISWYDIEDLSDIQLPLLTNPIAVQAVKSQTASMEDATDIALSPFFSKNGQDASKRKLYTQDGLKNSIAHAKLMMRYTDEEVAEILKNLLTDGYRRFAHGKINVDQAFILGPYFLRLLFDAKDRHKLESHHLDLEALMIFGVMYNNHRHSNIIQSNFNEMNFTIIDMIHHSMRDFIIFAKETASLYPKMCERLDYFIKSLDDIEDTDRTSLVKPLKNDFISIRNRLLNADDDNYAMLLKALAYAEIKELFYNAKKTLGIPMDLNGYTEESKRTQFFSKNSTIKDFIARVDNDKEFIREIFDFNKHYIHYSHWFHNPRQDTPSRGFSPSQGPSTS